MKNEMIYRLSKNLSAAQVTNRRILRKQVLKLKGKVLDLGCGNGEYSFLIARNKLNKVFALDSSKTLCDSIKKKADREKITNLKVFEADAHKLPFRSNFFDCCFCNAVIEHVKDAEAIVKEIRRVLKKNGTLIISCPFLQEVHGDPDDYRRFTPYGLRLFLEKNKFKPVKQFCDYGALNAIEYLLIGGFVWRTRLGFRKNFPFGYVYITLLICMFIAFKFLNWLFSFARKDDKHFITQVTLLAKKHNETIIN